MAARPDFATDLRAMCKRHYLGTNLARQAATLNDLQQLRGQRSEVRIPSGAPVESPIPPPDGSLPSRTPAHLVAGLVPATSFIAVEGLPIFFCSAGGRFWPYAEPCCTAAQG